MPDTVSIADGGYTCWTCRQWVSHGTLHACSSYQPAWNPQPAWWTTLRHPATIDLRCPCGASGRVEANTVEDANALAAPFYKAHEGHAPALEEKLP